MYRPCFLDLNLTMVILELESLKEQCDSDVNWKFNDFVNWYGYILNKKWVLYSYNRLDLIRTLNKRHTSVYLLYIKVLPFSPSLWTLYKLSSYSFGIHM